MSLTGQNLLRVKSNPLNDMGGITQGSPSHSLSQLIPSVPYSGYLPVAITGDTYVLLLQSFHHAVPYTCNTFTLL